MLPIVTGVLTTLAFLQAFPGPSPTPATPLKAYACAVKTGAVEAFFKGAPPDAYSLVVVKIFSHGRLSLSEIVPAAIGRDGQLYASLDLTSPVPHDAFVQCQLYTDAIGSGSDATCDKPQLSFLHVDSGPEMDLSALEVTRDRVRLVATLTWKQWFATTVHIARDFRAYFTSGATRSVSHFNGALPQSLFVDLQRRPGPLHIQASFDAAGHDFSNDVCVPAGLLP